MAVSMADLAGAACVLIVAVVTKDLPIDVSGLVALVVLLFYALLRALLSWCKRRSAPVQGAAASIAAPTPEQQRHRNGTPAAARDSAHHLEPVVTPPAGSKPAPLQRRQLQRANDSYYYFGLAFLCMSCSCVMIGMADIDQKIALPDVFAWTFDTNSDI